MINNMGTVSMITKLVILTSDDYLSSISLNQNCYHGNGIIITSTGTYMVKLHLLLTR